MKYREYGNVIICTIPDENELNMQEIENIVTHTHNTWQHNRPVSEIRKNTIQGKRAEIVIERILAAKSEMRYLSYDAIRRDNFKKHAPFDGVIFNKAIDETILAEAFEQISEDVRNSDRDLGTLTVKTREFLEDNGIFTVEIKSSLLQDPRDYREMTHKEKFLRTEEDYKALCKYIERAYDYFLYPHYCRDNSAIRSFYGYTVYVRSVRPDLINGIDTRGFLQNLMKTEFNNACNIYTRVFFDLLSDEIIIPGYVTKARFFEQPKINKMYSSKSVNAIYYMFPIRMGISISKIDQDVELKKWDRVSIYKNLLGACLPKCGVCGNEMKLVETTKSPDIRNHKFLYVCNRCYPRNWIEIEKLYNVNMDR